MKEDSHNRDLVKISTIILNLDADLLRNNELTEDQIRFFLGYSGWEHQQLEQELELNSWVVTPNEYKNKIIGKSYFDFWKEKMIEFGGDYLIWSNAPENPNYN